MDDVLWMMSSLMSSLTPDVIFALLGWYPQRSSLQILQILCECLANGCDPHASPHLDMLAEVQGLSIPIYTYLPIYT